MSAVRPQISHHLAKFTQRVFFIDLSRVRRSIVSSEATFINDYRHSLIVMTFIGGRHDAIVSRGQTRFRSDFHCFAAFSIRSSQPGLNVSASRPKARLGCESLLAVITSLLFEWLVRIGRATDENK